MSRFVLLAAAVVGTGLVWSAFNAPAFNVVGPSQHGSVASLGVAALPSPNFLAAPAATHQGAWGYAFVGLAAAGVCFALRGLAGNALRKNMTSKLATTIIACRAQSDDKHIESVAKQAVGGVASAVLLASSMGNTAAAYPIFAQQNYENPREATGKLACANCHLAGKYIDVRMPHEVLPDTIFKATIEIPCKYEKRLQPIASGEKGPLNVGAIAVMPEGWKLAPKDRLPKALKKELKGLAWAPYSKERPNIVVAGPVPGSRYETMVLPILAPDPNSQKDIYFDKYSFFFGGNRGRGQVYPEGNQSNNNQFFAPASGKVSAIDGLKVTITRDDGTTATQECLPGATLVVEVGEVVAKGDPITTNPNVGGFGQDDKEMVLQDMNRVYAYCALATSIFFAQLAFVLKKKQFEKVQLAEGF